MKKKILIISAIVLGILIIVAISARSISRKNSLKFSRGFDSAFQEAGFSSPTDNAYSGNQVISESSKNLIQEMPSEVLSDKKVIKNGNLTMKVSKAEETGEEISKIAKANQGEIFSSNFYQNSNNVKNGTITVKVPVNNFEKTFEELKKTATLVTRESISSQDATEQYADLESRIRNKQAEEQSFIKILDRAGTIGDVLNVTREISRVRGEIEVLQGKIKYLSSQTDMATISINISEDAEITITDSWRPLRVIKDTINLLFKDVQRFLNFAIVLIIRVIPVVILYLILVLVVFIFGRKAYRKIKSKKAENENNIIK